jgi:hypothetical protein
MVLLASGRRLNYSMNASLFCHSNKNIKNSAQCRSSYIRKSPLYVRKRTERMFEKACSENRTSGLSLRLVALPPEQMTDTHARGALCQ